MASELLTAVLVLLSSAANAEAPDIVSFRKLPSDQQLRIVGTAYQSVSVTLAVAGTEYKGTSAGKRLTSCLRDRDDRWALRTVQEYMANDLSMATSLGAAISQAFAWKCGVLTFSADDLR